MKILIFLIAFVLTSASYAAPSIKSGSFTPEQQAQIEVIVRNYLLQHPQLLMEMAEKLRSKSEDKNPTRRAIKQYANALFYSPSSPVLGNPNGNVTLVEFFDYQCPYCKQVTPMLADLAKQYPNLRIVMKEFPIFGDTSDYASRMALAAAEQNQYLVLHQALMKSPGHFSSNKDLLNLAKANRLDMERLSRNMTSATVMQEIKTNIALASVLGLGGTPAFIVASTPKHGSVSTEKVFFVQGAVSKKMLGNMIRSAS